MKSNKVRVIIGQKNSLVNKKFELSLARKTVFPIRRLSYLWPEKQFCQYLNETQRKKDQAKKKSQLVTAKHSNCYF